MKFAKYDKTKLYGTETPGLIIPGRWVKFRDGDVGKVIGNYSNNLMLIEWPNNGGHDNDYFMVGSKAIVGVVL